MAPTTKQLLKRLKTWCDKAHGRKSEVARRFGVSPQAVSNWFGGRQKPTGDQALAIQEFLRRHK